MELTQFKQRSWPSVRHTYTSTLHALSSSSADVRNRSSTERVFASPRFHAELCALVFCNIAASGSLSWFGVIRDVIAPNGARKCRMRDQPRARGAPTASSTPSSLKLRVHGLILTPDFCAVCVAGAANALHMLCAVSACALCVFFSAHGVIHQLLRPRLPRGGFDRGIRRRGSVGAGWQRGSGHGLQKVTGQGNAWIRCVAAVAYAMVTAFPIPLASHLAAFAATGAAAETAWLAAAAAVLLAVALVAAVAGAPAARLDQSPGGASSDGMVRPVTTLAAVYCSAALLLTASYAADAAANPAIFSSCTGAASALVSAVALRNLLLCRRRLRESHRSAAVGQASWSALFETARSATVALNPEQNSEGGGSMGVSAVCAAASAGFRIGYLPPLLAGLGLGSIAVACGMAAASDPLLSATSAPLEAALCVAVAMQIAAACVPLLTMLSVLTVAAMLRGTAGRMSSASYASRLRLPLYDALSWTLTQLLSHACGLTELDARALTSLASNTPSSGTDAAAVDRDRVPLASISRSALFQALSCGVVARGPSATEDEGYPLLFSKRVARHLDAIAAVVKAVPAPMQHILATEQLTTCALLEASTSNRRGHAAADAGTAGVAMYFSSDGAGGRTAPVIHFARRHSSLMSAAHLSAAPTYHHRHHTSAALLVHVSLAASSGTDFRRFLPGLKLLLPSSSFSSDRDNIVLTINNVDLLQHSYTSSSRNSVADSAIYSLSISACCTSNDVRAIAGTTLRHGAPLAASRPNALAAFRPIVARHKGARVVNSGSATRLVRRDAASEDAGTEVSQSEPPQAATAAALDQQKPSPEVEASVTTSGYTMNRSYDQGLSALMKGVHNPDANDRNTALSAESATARTTTARGSTRTRGAGTGREAFSASSPVAFNSSQGVPSHKVSPFAIDVDRDCVQQGRTSTSAHFQQHRQLPGSKALTLESSPVTTSQHPLSALHPLHSLHEVASNASIASVGPRPGSSSIKTDDSAPTTAVHSAPSTGKTAVLSAAAGAPVPSPLDLSDVSTGGQAVTPRASPAPAALVSLPPSLAALLGAPCGIQCQRTTSPSSVFASPLAHQSGSGGSASGSLRASSAAAADYGGRLYSGATAAAFRVERGSAGSAISQLHLGDLTMRSAGHWSVSASATSAWSSLRHKPYILTTNGGSIAQLADPLRQKQSVVSGSAGAGLELSASSIIGIVTRAPSVLRDGLPTPVSVASFSSSRLHHHHHHHDHEHKEASLSPAGTVTTAVSAATTAVTGTRAPPVTPARSVIAQSTTSRFSMFSGSTKRERLTTGRLIGLESPIAPQTPQTPFLRASMRAFADPRSLMRKQQQKQQPGSAATQAAEPQSIGSLPTPARAPQYLPADRRSRSAFDMVHHDDTNAGSTQPGGEAGERVEAPASFPGQAPASPLHQSDADDAAAAAQEPSLRVPAPPAIARIGNYGRAHQASSLVSSTPSPPTPSAAPSTTAVHAQASAASPPRVNGTTTGRNNVLGATGVNVSLPSSLPLLATLPGVLRSKSLRRRLQLQLVGHISEEASGDLLHNSSSGNFSSRKSKSGGSLNSRSNNRIEGSSRDVSGKGQQQPLQISARGHHNSDQQLVASHDQNRLEGQSSSPGTPAATLTGGFDADGYLHVEDVSCDTDSTASHRGQCANAACRQCHHLFATTDDVLELLRGGIRHRTSHSLSASSSLTAKAELLQSKSRRNSCPSVPALNAFRFDGDACGAFERHSARQAKWANADASVEVLRTLVAGGACSETRLVCISGIHVDIGAATSLMAVLRRMGKLVDLDLSGCSMSDEAAIVYLAHWCSLGVRSLCRVQLPARGAGDVQRSGLMLGSSSSPTPIERTNSGHLAAPTAPRVKAAAVNAGNAPMHMHVAIEIAAEAPAAGLPQITPVPAAVSVVSGATAAATSNPSDTAVVELNKHISGKERRGSKGKSKLPKQRANRRYTSCNGETTSSPRRRGRSAAPLTDAAAGKTSAAVAVTPAPAAAAVAIVASVTGLRRDPLLETESDRSPVPASNRSTASRLSNVTAASVRTAITTTNTSINSRSRIIRVQYSASHPVSVTAVPALPLLVAPSAAAASFTAATDLSAPSSFSSSSSSVMMIARYEPSQGQLPALWRGSCAAGTAAVTMPDSARQPSSAIPLMVSAPLVLPGQRQGVHVYPPFRGGAAVVPAGAGSAAATSSALTASTASPSTTIIDQLRATSQRRQTAGISAAFRLPLVRAQLHSQANQLPSLASSTAAQAGTTLPVHPAVPKPLAMLPDPTAAALTTNSKLAGPGLTAAAMIGSAPTAGACEQQWPQQATTAKQQHGHGAPPAASAAGVVPPVIEAGSGGSGGAGRNAKLPQSALDVVALSSGFPSEFSLSMVLDTPLSTRRDPVGNVIDAAPASKHTTVGSTLLPLPAIDEYSHQGQLAAYGRKAAQVNAAGQPVPDQKLALPSVPHMQQQITNPPSWARKDVTAVAFADGGNGSNGEHARSKLQQHQATVQLQQQAASNAHRPSALVTSSSSSSAAVLVGGAGAGSITAQAIPATQTAAIWQESPSTVGHRTPTPHQILQQQLFPHASPSVPPSATAVVEPANGAVAAAPRALVPPMLPMATVLVASTAARASNDSADLQAHCSVTVADTHADIHDRQASIRGISSRKLPSQHSFQVSGTTALLGDAGGNGAGCGAVAGGGDGAMINDWRDSSRASWASGDTASLVIMPAPTPLSSLLDPRTLSALQLQPSRVAAVAPAVPVVNVVAMNSLTATAGAVTAAAAVIGVAPTAVVPNPVHTTTAVAVSTTGVAAVTVAAVAILPPPAPAVVSPVLLVHAPAPSALELTGGDAAASGLAPAEVAAAPATATEEARLPPAPHRKRTSASASTQSKAPTNNTANIIDTERFHSKPAIDQRRNPWEYIRDDGIVTNSRFTDRGSRSTYHGDGGDDRDNDGGRGEEADDESGSQDGSGRGSNCDSDTDESSDEVNNTRRTNNTSSSGSRGGGHTGTSGSVSGSLRRTYERMKQHFADNANTTTAAGKGNSGSAAAAGSASVPAEAPASAISTAPMQTQAPPASSVVNTPPAASKQPTYGYARLSASAVATASSHPVIHDQVPVATSRAATPAGPIASTALAAQVQHFTVFKSGDAATKELPPRRPSGVPKAQTGSKSSTAAGAAVAFGSAEAGLNSHRFGFLESSDTRSVYSLSSLADAPPAPAPAPAGHSQQSAEPIAATTSRRIAVPGYPVLQAASGATSAIDVPTVHLPRAAIPSPAPEPPRPVASLQRPSHRHRHSTTGKHRGDYDVDYTIEHLSPITPDSGNHGSHALPSASAAVQGGSAARTAAANHYNDSDYGMVEDYGYTGNASSGARPTAASSSIPASNGLNSAAADQSGTGMRSSRSDTSVQLMPLQQQQRQLQKPQHGNSGFHIATEPGRPSSGSPEPSDHVSRAQSAHSGSKSSTSNNGTETMFVLTSSRAQQSKQQLLLQRPSSFTAAQQQARSRPQQQQQLPQKMKQPLVKLDSSQSAEDFKGFASAASTAPISAPGSLTSRVAPASTVDPFAIGPQAVAPAADRKPSVPAPMTATAVASAMSIRSPSARGGQTIQLTSADRQDRLKSQRDIIASANARRRAQRGSRGSMYSLSSLAKQFEEQEAMDGQAAAAAVAVVDAGHHVPMYNFMHASMPDGDAAHSRANTKSNRDNNAGHHQDDDDAASVASGFASRRGRFDRNSDEQHQHHHQHQGDAADDAAADDVDRHGASAGNANGPPKVKVNSMSSVARRAHHSTANCSNSSDADIAYEDDHAKKMRHDLQYASYNLALRQAHRNSKVAGAHSESSGETVVTRRSARARAPMAPAPASSRLIATPVGGHPRQQQQQQLQPRSGAYQSPLLAGDVGTGAGLQSSSSKTLPMPVTQIAVARLAAAPTSGNAGIDHPFDFSATLGPQNLYRSLAYMFHRGGNQAAPHVRAQAFRAFDRQSEDSRAHDHDDLEPGSEFRYSETEIFHPDARDYTNDRAAAAAAAAHGHAFGESTTTGLHRVSGAADSIIDGDSHAQGCGAFGRRGGASCFQQEFSYDADRFTVSTRFTRVSCREDAVDEGIDKVHYALVAHNAFARQPLHVPALDASRLAQLYMPHTDGALHSFGAVAAKPLNVSDATAAAPSADGTAGVSHGASRLLASPSSSSSSSALPWPASTIPGSHSDRRDRTTASALPPPASALAPAPPRVALEAILESSTPSPGSLPSDVDQKQPAADYAAQRQQHNKDTSVVIADSNLGAFSLGGGARPAVPVPASSMLAVVPSRAPQHSHASTAEYYSYAAGAGVSIADTNDYSHAYTTTSGSTMIGRETPAHKRAARKSKKQRGGHTGPSKSNALNGVAIPVVTAVATRRSKEAGAVNVVVSGATAAAGGMLASTTAGEQQQI